MKKIVFICILALCLIMPVSAAGSDLNLRVEAIRERGSTYTSVTDLHEVDLLTAQTSEIERQYRDIINRQRQSTRGHLFDTGDIVQLSYQEKVARQAGEWELFSGVGGDEIYYRPPVSAGDDAISPLVYGVLIGLLCLGGFLFSNHRHKRRKERNRDVHNGNAGTAP